MNDASEDEKEEDFNTSSNVHSRTSVSKFERTEQLRKMMEDEGRKTRASASAL